MELTMVQGRTLKLTVDELWTLLTCDEYNQIIDIFIKAADREIQRQENEESWLIGNIFVKI